MKMFRSTGNDSVTYIQLKDIEALIMMGESVPLDVKQVIDKYKDKINDSNRDSFISIVGNKSKWFFVGCEWILDLDECYVLDEHDFEMKAYSMRNAILNIERDRMEKSGLTKEECRRQIFMLNYRYKALRDIHEVRKGTSKIILPVEPNKDRSKVFRLEMKEIDFDD